MKRSTWTKKVLLTIGWAIAATGVFAAVSPSATDVDLRDDMVANSYTPVTEGKGWTYGSAATVFDGKNWSTNSEIRAMGNLYAVGGPGTGMYARLGLADEYLAGKRVVLTKYRIHRHSRYRSAYRDPTRWRIYGLPDDATDENTGDWVLLHEQAEDYTYPTGIITEHEETNEFTIASSAAARGFRRFHFEPVSSTGYASSVSKGSNQYSGGYDFGLNEVEFFADVYDTPLVVVASDCEGTAIEGSFSPAVGEEISAAGTISAPSVILSNGVGYRCAGYAIESYDEASGAWTTLSENRDGKNSFDFDAFPEAANARQRVRWLYDEMMYTPDVGPMRITDYCTARGVTAKNCAFGDNLYSESAGGKNAFDGVRWTSSYSRVLGYLTKGDVDVGLDFTGVTAALSEGDEFYLSKYRVYMLSVGGSEVSRAPTAWYLETKAADDSAYTTADSRTGVSWSSNSKDSEATAYQEFTPATVAGFNNIRFRPTSSSAYESNPTASSTTINVGFMEIDLYVNAANPKGTLRVKIGRDGYDTADVFSPALGTLVDTATTITAPKTVTKEGADSLYKVVGYRLEKFNETTCAWEQDGDEEYTEALSYSFTPDATAAYRLIWLVETTPSIVEISVGGTRLVGGETISFSPASADGLYSVGDTVTLTATASGDDLTAADCPTNAYHSTFVRWEGDLDGLDIDATSAAISFTVDRPREIKAVFARDWLLYEYDRANEGGSGTEWRIKNGIWEFKVESSDLDVNIANAGYIAGSGDLDFTEGAICKPGSSTAARILGIGANVLNGKSNVSSNLLTSVVLPLELKTIGAGAFRNQEKLTNLVANCSELTTMGDSAFTRCYLADRVTLKLPKLVSLGGSYTFFGLRMAETDTSDWNLSALTNVNSQGLHQESSYLPGENCGQTLDLPSLSVISSSGFSNNKVFSDYCLGTNKCSLTEIGSYAFGGARGVVSLTIGSKKRLTVASNACNNMGSGWASIRMLGAAPEDRTAMDNLLESNSTNNYCRLYVGRKWPEWRNYVTAKDAIEDADFKATVEAEGADGAWITADGTYKAVVYYVDTPFKPQGLAIVLR